MKTCTTNLQQQMSHWRHQAVLEQVAKPRTTPFGKQLVGNSGKRFAIRGLKHDCGKWAMLAKCESLGTVQFLPFDPYCTYALRVHIGPLGQRQILVYGRFQ
jgi:hypothetical protein